MKLPNANPSKFLFKGGKYSFMFVPCFCRLHRIIGESVDNRSKKIDFPTSERKCPFYKLRPALAVAISIISQYQYLWLWPSQYLNISSIKSLACETKSFPEAGGNWNLENEERSILQFFRQSSSLKSDQICIFIRNQVQGVFYFWEVLFSSPVSNHLFINFTRMRRSENY